MDNKDLNKKSSSTKLILAIILLPILGHIVFSIADFLVRVYPSKGSYDFSIFFSANFIISCILMLIGFASFITSFVCFIVLLVRVLKDLLDMTSKKIFDKNLTECANAFMKNKIVKISIISVAVILYTAIVLYANIEEYKEYKETYIDTNVTIADGTTLFTDEKISINVDDMFFSDKKFTLRFSLINNSNKYYNFNITELKVNDSRIPFGTSSTSNFSAINKLVSPFQASSDYEIYIWQSELNKYDIKTISELGFKIELYENEENNEFVDKTTCDEFIIIKTEKIVK